MELEPNTPSGMYNIVPNYAAMFFHSKICSLCLNTYFRVWTLQIVDVRLDIEDSRRDQNELVYWSEEFQVKAELRHPARTTDTAVKRKRVRPSAGTTDTTPNLRRQRINEEEEDVKEEPAVAADLIPDLEADKRRRAQECLECLIVLDAEYMTKKARYLKELQMALLG